MNFSNELEQILEDLQFETYKWQPGTPGCTAAVDTAKAQILSKLDEYIPEERNTEHDPMCAFPKRCDCGVEANVAYNKAIKEMRSKLQ